MGDIGWQIGWLARVGGGEYVTTVRELMPSLEPRDALGP